MLLVIGTSMQTMFANMLVCLAEQCEMKVHFVNENTEDEVPKFLIENVFLAKN